MAMQNAALKVKREHVEKLALIYVRQSTLQGVQQNITGGRRQREDVERLALQLGWRKENIKIIDDDQARSGTSTHRRFGYLDMLDAISKSCVGAVFSLESTRVGRDMADWHFLIKLCHVTGTLVIDPEGVYDASDMNDNTLMKIKALVGEVELHYITERMIGAKLKLAQEGTLRVPLPAGFVYSEDGAIILAPDPAVQDAIRFGFDLFDKLGSARGVAHYFNQNSLRFPSIIRTGPSWGQHEWVELTGNRMGRVLQNPFYAGAFVYGRSKTQRTAVVGPGGVPQIQKYQITISRADWPVVIYDAHPAYISWARYLQNTERLTKNFLGRAREGLGAARMGSALLQGITICGTCGCKLFVRYRDKFQPYYMCSGDADKGGKECQYVSATIIDAEVEKLFLQAVEPVKLEVSLDAFQRIEERSVKQDRQLVARHQRAERLVESLKKRLLRVDYNNKYAFDAIQEELRRREEELLGMKRQKELDQQAVTDMMSEAERQSIETLARNIPLIWSAKTTDMVIKKNLLRCLVEDVTLKRTGWDVQVLIRWKTQASTKLNVRLPTTSELHRTGREVTDLIEKLAPDHTTREIAEALINAGMRTKRGLPFTENRLNALYKTFHWGRYSRAPSKSGATQAPQ
jgi:DNA invertase Pin-like site-specific DNA recombinase